ncbi:C-factor [Vibrio sp. JCM 19236]|nr:C-factor [Vibrio sp. JCM 19236]
MLPSTQIEATYLNRHPDINGGKVNWHQLDLTKEDQIETFSHQFEQVDWLINCVGILHCKHHGPEKSIRQLDSDFFMDNIKRNTLPTLLLAKYFQDKLMPNSTNPQTYAKLVTLSDAWVVLEIIALVDGIAIAHRKLHSIWQSKRYILNGKE